MPKFSVIIPTTKDRWIDGKLSRAMRSIYGQNYKDWEMIVVNTNRDPLENFRSQNPQVKLVEMGWDCERVYGRNAGMRMATGEALNWLDADDEYTSNYFDKLDEAIETYPEAVCFNFGALVHWHGLRSSVRPTFKPQELGLETFVGAEFKSGRIATGSFVFKRSLLDEVRYKRSDSEPYSFGFLPEAISPYGGPDSFSAKCHNPNYPQLPTGEYPPMGNPWGDDYQMFYQITRKFDSQPLDLILYLQNVR